MNRSRQHPSLAERWVESRPEGDFILLERDWENKTGREIVSGIAFYDAVRYDLDAILCNRNAIARSRSCSRPLYNPFQARRELLCQMKRTSMMLSAHRAGRGKQDGALHEIQPVDLLANLLNALQTRNHLDTSQVDDVVIGCVTPLAEQGGVIARSAVLHAGWETNVPGVQLDRFCASGLEAVNTAAMQVRSGWHDLVVAGGVESMSRLSMGSDGGAWFMEPRGESRKRICPTRN